jgi:hypothetical protein
MISGSSRSETSFFVFSDWVGAFAALRVELGVFGLERVGDVFEENQAEQNMLVLGRIHVVAQPVGRLPQLYREAERRTVAIPVICAVPFCRPRAIAAPCQPVAPGEIYHA